MTVGIYKTPSLKQRIVYNGQLIGCTDTSFAMAGNERTLPSL